MEYQRTGSHALPRPSMTQGWSDSRPSPRLAAYASRGNESYKGWGEGHGTALPPAAHAQTRGETPSPRPSPPLGEREKKEYNARMNDVSILDTVARATRLREGPAGVAAVLRAV